MQINVSARHGHLSAASQSKISAKVSRLKRYFDLSCGDVLDHFSKPICADLMALFTSFSFDITILERTSSVDGEIVFMYFLLFGC